MGDKRDKTLSELAFTIADHQARIEKLGMKWAAILTDRLDATEKALMAEISAYMEKHSRGLNSLSSLTALHRLEKKIAAIRKEAFAQAQQEIMPEAGELADNEQKWAEKITETLAPESADKLSLVNKKALNDGLGKQLIESRTAEEWFSGTASADVMRINDMVREGVRSGWTIQEMTRRIVGTKANNYTDGLLETSRSHATTMARTLCCGVANNAKDQFYQENDDVVIGVEWLDTLDSRTCSRCGGLSRKRWKTKEPHPVPPAHHNCRCVLIPVTELTDLGDDAFRPAANADFDAEAKELYETKYPGKKYEDLAPSTRKKYFYEAQKAYTARTGNPPYRQVPGNMTFSEYFEQMPEKEKERYLGPGRYEVWKNGNLPLTKFFPPYPERMYSVKELKEMDKKSFVSGTVHQPSGERSGDSTRIIVDGKSEFPKGGKYKKLKPYYNAAMKSEQDFIEKLTEDNPDREFAGVWDKDKNLVCVAMGGESHVSYRVPISGGIVVHNHPRGTPPSWGDFKEFVDKRLTEMDVVTKNGRFVLKTSEENAILSMEALKKRFFNVIGERDYISLEEWKEVLNGSGYEISFINS